jgi:hypothetical protein
MRTGFDGHVCATAQSDIVIVPANIASLCNKPMDSSCRRAGESRSSN